MTKKALRNLLNRCARLLELSAKAHDAAADDLRAGATAPMIRVLERGVARQLRTTARECRDAAAKGISA